MKSIGLLVIAALLIISNAKRLPIEEDDDVESSEIDTRSFLNKYETNYDKQMNSLDCVPCKFNLIPCCKPNLCIKKSFRPDECLKLKPRNQY